MTSKKKFKFIPSRPLPTELTIPSTNNNLFEMMIGLSLINFDDAKRPLIIILYLYE